METLYNIIIKSNIIYLQWSVGSVLKGMFFLQFLILISLGYFNFMAELLAKKEKSPMI